VLKGKSYPCASGYFVSVALANAAGVNTGPEYMRWLTDADYASFGPITNFNLTGFFASYGQVFVPGEYYHVKLALGPTWNETSILVYVKPAIVSSGMTAWFPLNETSGTIATELFGNSGEYLGDVTHVIGVVGGAARFGTTGDIRVPNTAVADIGTGDFSFSVWIQTTLMGTAAILDKEQENSGPVTGYGLEISNGKPLLQLASGGAWQNYVSSTFVADGLWHHLVVTVDRDSSTGVRFYVDGVLAGTGNPLAVSGSLSNSFPLFIGGRADSTFGSPYVGDIDEVLIYNRSLDATEVSALYGGGTPSSCP
jgi:hypothetical protein